MNNELNELDKAWFAGFFDGEGSIYTKVVGKSKYLYLRIEITLSDLDILERYKYFFGGTIYERKKYTNKKKCYSYIIGDNEYMKLFLENILNYSILKKQQIVVGIELLNEKNTNKKIELSNELKRLKNIVYAD